MNFKILKTFINSPIIFSARGLTGRITPVDSVTYTLKHIYLPCSLVQMIFSELITATECDVCYSWSFYVVKNNRKVDKWNLVLNIYYF